VGVVEVVGLNVEGSTLLVTQLPTGGLVRLTTRFEVALRHLLTLLVNRLLPILLSMQASKLRRLASLLGSL
jgi:hypothetical protein